MTVKTVLTIAFTAIALLAVLFVVLQAQTALGLTLGAALIALALDHPVTWLEGMRVKRPLAVAAVAIAVFVGVTGVLLILIPPAVTQGREMVAEAPRFIERARGTRWYERLNRRLDLDAQIERARQELGARAEQLVTAGLRAVEGVLSAVVATITLFFLVLFMLLFGGRLVRAVLAEAIPQRRARYERVAASVYRSVGGYLSGLSLICTVNALATTAFLATIRVPFFLPLGILSGLSSLVPLVGNTVAGMLITLLVLITRGAVQAIVSAAFFILYQQWENHILGPLVYKRTVRLNPLVVLISLLFFAELWGIAGALLAVPATAIAQVVLREILLFRRERLHLPTEGRASQPPGLEEQAQA